MHTPAAHTCRKAQRTTDFQVFSADKFLCKLRWKLSFQASLSCTLTHRQTHTVNTCSLTAEGVGGRLERNKTLLLYLVPAGTPYSPPPLVSLFISSIIRHCLSKKRKTTESTYRSHSSSSVLPLICLFLFAGHFEPASYFCCCQHISARFLSLSCLFAPSNPSFPLLSLFSFFPQLMHLFPIRKFLKATKTDR